jgi:hypothetical protein
MFSAVSIMLLAAVAVAVLILIVFVWKVVVLYKQKIASISW